MRACCLRYDVLPDGRVVSTVDLMAYYLAPLTLPTLFSRRQWIADGVAMCNQKGRYETMFDHDIDHFYHARTWQQALAIHEALVAHPDRHRRESEVHDRLRSSVLDSWHGDGHG